MSTVKINSIKAWILAARPKTLTGAAVPVMIGTAFAWKNCGAEMFQMIPAILCFLFAFVMQIDANFINDYFDCLKGNDDSSTRLGPKRACSEGWITLKAMRWGLMITTLLACLIGLPLIYFGGIEMIIIGIICVLFCFLYTTKLSYIGLGDLLVLVFFGIIPVCLTYYVIVPKDMQYIPWTVFLTSLGCGLVIDTLLCINNFRDRNNDKKDGKITLIVRLGENRGYKLYQTVGFIGVILTMIAILIEGMEIDKNQETILALTAFIPYTILLDMASKKMKSIWKGKELNLVLGMTARNMFIYGLTTVLSILIIQYV